MSTKTNNGRELENAPDTDRFEQNSTIKSYLRFARNYPILSLEEEQEIARRYRNGDKHAAELLVYHNMRFVLKVAMQYRRSMLSLDDIIQEGMIGALEAAERFNVDFNVRFTTFAKWWISNKILKAIATKSGTVVIPRHIRSKLSRLVREEEDLCKKLAIKPDSYEIETKLEKLQEKILLLTRDLPTEKRITRLDAPILGQDRTHAETIHDPNAVDPNSVLANDLMNKFLHRLLETLTVQERYILMSRFGFDSDKPKVLHEIAEKIGLSRERVRQIEVEALSKLKRKLAAIRREADNKRATLRRGKNNADSNEEQHEPPTERAKLVIVYKQHQTTHDLENVIAWWLDRPS